MLESPCKQNIWVVQTVKWVPDGFLMKPLDIAIHFLEISPYDTSKELIFPMNWPP